jgi:hypothetical protein
MEGRSRRINLGFYKLEKGLIEDLAKNNQPGPEKLWKL